MCFTQHAAALALLIDTMRIQLGVEQHGGCQGAGFFKYITSCSSVWRFGGFSALGFKFSLWGKWVSGRKSLSLRQTSPPFVTAHTEGGGQCWEGSER